MAGSLVFMIVYVWSREFPNARISIYGLVTLKVCYLFIYLFSLWFLSYYWPVLIMLNAGVKKTSYHQGCNIVFILELS